MYLFDDTIGLFDFIGGLFCHQRPERSLLIGGHYLPVCARDTGALIGLLLGYALLVILRKKEAKGPPGLYVTLAMFLPLLVDSFGQAFGFWTSTNDVRLITGLIFGTALAPLLVYALSLPPLKGNVPLFRRIQPQAPVPDSKDSWFTTKALTLGIAISVLLFFGIRSLVGSESVLFYWTLSIPVVLGIIWHLTIVPVLLIIAVLRALFYAK